MSEIMFNILQVVIMAAVFFVSRYLIPYLKSKAENTAFCTVLDLISEAVAGAEQVFCDPKTGQKKKQKVMDLVMDYCADHNIAITEEQVSALIESAVFAFNRSNEGVVYG